MKQSQFSDPVPEDAFDAAAEWWYRMQTDPALKDCDAFQKWMEVQEHASAFEAVVCAMDGLRDLGAMPRILEMRRSALARVQRSGILRPRRLIHQVSAAALLIALVGGTVMGVVYLKYENPTYATEFGERRVIALSDGSQILLDSNSKLSVHYTKGMRAIILEEGRARFDVAHDTRRPFTVTAGDETVVAVGTSFEVEENDSKVLVTLIQGHVLVKNADGATTKDETTAKKVKSNAAVSLESGQQMIAANYVAPIVSPVDLKDATAWESGQLVFRAAQLGDAVEQVNRYTDHPVKVDPSVYDIKISGVFNAGDVGAFVNAITAYFPVSATADGNGTITLQRRS
jgi:transmembrane sensor